MTRKLVAMLVGAMALVVAGLIAEGETIVDGAEVIDDSFPGFVGLMRGLGAEIE